MDNMNNEQLIKDVETAQQRLNNIEEKLSKNPDDYATDYTEAKDKLKDAQWRLDKFNEKEQETTSTEIAEFKMKLYKQAAFKSEFRDICSEINISGNQLTFNKGETLTVCLMPKTYVDKMSEEQIARLNGFQ